MGQTLQADAATQPGRVAGERLLRQKMGYPVTVAKTHATSLAAIG